MRYYLLRRSGEFVIYTVAQDRIFDCLERHHREVLLEASSLMQLLILLEKEWLYHLKWT